MENLNLLWITEKRREQPDNRRREVGNTVKKESLKKEKSLRPSFFLDNFVSSTKLIVNIIGHCEEFLNLTFQE